MYLYVPNKIMQPWRLAAIITGILAVILVGIIVGPKVYQRWQVHRLMKEANAKLRAGQLREGITPLVKVLAINPKSWMANRMISDAAEKLGSPEALAFREKALEIDPTSLEDATRLATAALVFENIPKAEKGIALIEKIPGAPTGLLPTLKAQLAVLKGDNAGAERAFAEALRANPENADLKISLAGLQVESSDADVQKAAVQVLTEARKIPKFRVQALRGLLKNAMARKDSFEMFSIADELVLEKSANFSDRLQRLTLLHQSKDLSFKSYLDTLEKEAVRSYVPMNLLLQWIAQNDVPEEAKPWINGIPTQYLTKPPLAVSMADVYLKMEDWPSLIDLTQGEDWNDSDDLRLAYLAVAQARTGRRESSRATWEDGLQLARGNLVKLQRLLAMATTQGWEDERIALLWKVADLEPDPVEHLQTLRQYHLQHMETASAYEACDRLLKLGSTTPELSADWLYLSLLLNKNPAQAFSAAFENWQKAPESHLDVARLALGYLRQSRFPEAYYLLKNQPPSALVETLLATYFGIASAEMGLFNAGFYLNLGLGQPMFPEEMVLVRGARRKIDQDWLPEPFPARTGTIESMDSLADSVAIGSR